jgi:hypothetical protein
MDAQTGAESALKGTAIRAVPDTHPRKGQSAVTNGRRLHVVRPGDNAWGRRFRDVLNEILSDMGGHDAGLSEAQRQLARRAATISIACEKLEGEIAAGKDIDLDQYGTLTDRLGRCLQRLGLKRQARDVTPSVAEILREDALRWQEEQQREVAEAAAVEEETRAP